jgi:hypothetical protein
MLDMTNLQKLSKATGIAEQIAALYSPRRKQTSLWRARRITKPATIQQ